MATQYKFQQDIEYSIRTNFMYLDPPKTPIPGQPADGDLFPDGRVEEKTITWTVGSNSKFEYGFFLDGSPWIKDNGDLHLVSVTPVPVKNLNSWFEDVDCNQTAINPDFGKVFSEMVGPMAWGGIGDIRDFESAYSPTVNYSGGAAVEWSFKCVPDDRGYTNFYDGNETYDLYGSQYISPTYRDPTNNRFGTGSETWTYPMPFDQRGYLLLGNQYAEARNQPRAWEGSCAITNIQDVVFDNAEPNPPSCDLESGVPLEHQEWISNWPARFNWQYGRPEWYSAPVGSENPNTGVWDADPEGTKWFLEPGLAGEPGSDLFENGKQFYGTARGNDPAEGYQQMVRSSGLFLDRDGIERWSGIWDGSSDASLLKAYDVVVSSISHWDEKQVDNSRQYWKDRYERRDEIIEEERQGNQDGYWAFPPGRDQIGNWGYSAGGSRAAFIDMYGILTILPEPKELPTYTIDDVEYEGLPSNVTTYAECFRPPVNWDPTDRKNIPIVSEIDDIDDYTFNGKGALRGQKGYPVKPMDTVIGDQVQPDKNWIRTTIGDGDDEVTVLYTLADYIYPDNYPPASLGDAFCTPDDPDWKHEYPDCNRHTTICPRFGTQRLWLGACQQDEKTQGFNDSYSCTFSEYGGSVANLAEAIAALGWDRNLDSDELRWHAQNENAWDLGYQPALKYLYDVFVTDKKSGSYNLRKVVRRAIAQRGIDSCGGIMSLGKYNMPNAGHTDYWDWYILAGYTSTKDVRFKYMLDGNVGSERNGTIKFGSGDDPIQDAIDYFDVKDNSDPIFGASYNRHNFIGSNGQQLNSIKNGDSYGVNRMYHNQRMEDLVVTRVDDYVYREGETTTRQQDDREITFPNIKITVAPPHGTATDANYLDNVISMIRAFNVQERQSSEDMNPSTNPQCGMRTMGMQEPLITYPVDPPYVDGYDEEISGGDLSNISYKEKILGYVPDDNIIEINGQKMNYWGGRDGDHNFYQDGDVVEETGEVCGIDFPPSVVTNWYYPHDRLYWSQLNCDLRQFGQYNPSDESLGCNLNCYGDFKLWAGDTNSATSNLSSGSMYNDGRSNWTLSGFGKVKPIWGNGDNLGNYRPNRLSGMYVKNKRNGNMTRIVSSYVEHNEMFECSAATPDPVRTVTNNSGVSVQYEIFTENPSYRSLYFVLQDDIDCQPGDEVDMFPCTQDDIDNRTANFGSINSVTGLGGVAGEVNYAFVFNRGILACGISGRVLNEMDDESLSQSTKVQISENFPEYFKDIYITRASFYENAVNRAGVDDYAGGNYWSVGNVTGNSWGPNGTGLLWRALIVDQVLYPIGVDSAAEYDSKEANRIRAYGEYSQLNQDDEENGIVIGSPWVGKNTWPEVPQGDDQYIGYCHTPSNVTGILNSPEILLFSDGNGSGWDQEDGQSISFGVDNLGDGPDLEFFYPSEGMSVQKTIIGKRFDGSTDLDLQSALDYGMSEDDYNTYRTHEGIVITSGTGRVPSQFTSQKNEETYFSENSNESLLGEGGGGGGSNPRMGTILPYESYVEGKELFCWFKGTNRPVKMIKIGQTLNNGEFDDKITLSHLEGQPENSINWEQVWVLPDTYEDGTALKFWPSLMPNLVPKFLRSVTFFYADTDQV